MLMQYPFDIIILMHRFNVQMDRPIFSSKYDSGKGLMETFGRGKLPLFQEPNLSERNKFELSKMSKEKNSEPFKQQSNKKKLKESRFRKTNYNKQNDNPTPKRQNIHSKNHQQFEQIDEISHKISTIIKSISNSTSKKLDHSASKTCRLERSQTTSKLSKLHNKYNNTHNKNNELDFKKRIAEQLKQDKHKTPLQEKMKINCQPKWLEQGLSKVKSSELSWKVQPPLHTDRHIYNNSPRQLETEDDDINDRIQIINDKISKYQEKMSGYQELYSVNKLKNEQIIRQFDEGHEEKSVWKSKFCFDEDKSVRKSNFSIKNSYVEQQGLKKKEIKDFSSQNSNPLQSQKKLSYFTEKYKSILQNSKKNDTNKMQNHEKFNKNKENISKIPIKSSLPLEESKKSNVSYQRKHFDKKNIQSEAFIKAIQQQISLDQDFRYAKHMFAGMEELFGEPSTSSNEKWRKLKHQLQNEGYSFSIQQVQEIFMPRDDEIDPFMSVSHSHQELIHSVVFAYQTAQEHWRNSVYRNWSFWQLKQNEFTSDVLDRGRKGYINPQDLTFFINTRLNGEYRNRDLMIIFNRLSTNSKEGKNAHKLKFKEIMNMLLSE